MELSFSIPDYWLPLRTDQSVLWQELLPLSWLQCTGSSPVQEFRRFRGVFTVDPEVAATLPRELRAAAPPGCGLKGVVIRSFGDLAQARKERPEFLFLMGEECAGSCGEEGVMVLLPEALSLGVPVIVRGGYGAATLAGFKLLGVEEVLLEELFWATLPFLPEPWRNLWERGSAFETRVYEVSPGERVRVFSRPGFPVVRRALEGNHPLLPATPEAPDPRERYLPAGSGTGLAGALNLPGELHRRKEALKENSERIATGVARDWPFLPGQGFAREEGCRLPISQGPMANVAESPEFARRVAEAGAFPWLALASMPEEPASRLLAGAKRTLGELPFGAGIIGLTTNRFLEVHLKLLKEFGIPRVLVAAGTPELGVRLLKEGARPYLHTPSPEGLEEAIAQGLNHFVWEGREAGGHVGVLPALALFEQNLSRIAALLNHREQGRTFTVLLAGGLFTRESFILAAGFAEALREYGHRTGVQMGSAYLFTEEARRFGAIADPYPAILARIRKTVILGSELGTPTRVLCTEKAELLRKEEERWRRERLPFAERKARFEEANFGALRLAARKERIVWEEGRTTLKPATLEEAFAEGLFHMGSVAHYHRVTTMADLHARVSEPLAGKAGEGKGNLAVLSGKGKEVEERAVAIVGVRFLLPGGIGDFPGLYDFLKRKGSAITEVPRRHWNPELFYDPRGVDPLKSYTKIGAFLPEEEEPFQRIKLPPRTLKALDPTQILALRLAERLLLTEPYPMEDQREREATEVILGVAVGGDLKDRTTLRIVLSALTASGYGDLSPEHWEELLGFTLPELNEDSMPGELANVCAGRVAALLDLSGGNFTVDSACASSLHALSVAVERLRAGKARWVVAGGVDRNMGVSAYVKFSRLNALARTGSYPFDRRAEGFVMGEGGGLFLLRPLRDALREGNRIYGVILGVGLASDGKGKGITAPNPQGQRRAILRALEDAGITPEGIAAVEAHGTGTPVGDEVETRVLKEVFASLRRPLGIGSVKGNLGHLKAAAGAAGLCKALLMLGRRTLLPSGGYREPREELALKGDPLYVLETLERFPEGVPLRMGVSAFGFGGTNAHLIVEAGDELPAWEGEVSPQENLDKKDNDSNTIAISYQDHRDLDIQQQASGGSMDHRSVLDETALFARVKEVVSEISGYDPGELGEDLDFEGDLGIDTVKIAEIAATLRKEFELPRDPNLKLSRLSTIRKMVEYLKERLQGRAQEGGEEVTEREESAALPQKERAPKAPSFLSRVREEVCWGEIPGYRFAFLREEAPPELPPLLEAGRKGKEERRKLALKRLYMAPSQGRSVAYLFPGQGSQRVGMLRELREVEVVAATVAEAEETLATLLDRPLSLFLYGDPEDPRASELEEILKETRYTQPILVTVEIALYRLLKELGLTPHAVAGHSLGEFSACVAAGVLSFPEALRLVSGRARSMEEVARRVEDPGKMVAVALSGADAERFLEEEGLKGLEIANYNSPRQTVIGGPSGLIENLITRLEKRGIPFKELRVSHAFHTSLVAPAAEPMAELLRRANLKLPEIPIYSNVTGARYPRDLEEIHRLLTVQLKSPVRFVTMVQNMVEEEKVSLFLEVGPGRALAHLAQDSLAQEVGAFPVLPGKEPALKSLARALAAVWVYGGVPVLSEQGRVRVPLAPSVLEPVPEEHPSPSAPEKGSPVPFRVQVAREEEPPPLQPDELVISGMALAIPGSGDPFSQESILALLRGENRITPLPEEARHVLSELGLEQVVKGEDGEITTRPITSLADTPAYAGQLELPEDLTPLGVRKGALSIMDRTSRLAVAGAIRALHDAGIPLVPAEGEERGDCAYILPPPLSRSTGVIFATVFGGLDVWIEVLTKRRPFPRTFLVEALCLGHSHIARLLKISGPTLKLDTACASTVTALAVAEDWLKSGRVERVLVVGCDLAGNLPFYPYIAAGFLSVGALSTHPELEKAALPFGAGRHGTIIGSGMVAFLLERAGSALKRGVHPRARLMGTRIFNDACHPMRMHPGRIAEGLRELLAELSRRNRLPEPIPAERFLFVSHEPFTPKRGGSAEAEAEALQAVFQEEVWRVPIVNLKGYTGHPMGASLEDGLCVLLLESGYAPPLRNLKELDPAFSHLHFSEGEEHRAHYALHLAAGFGAQSGWVLYGKVPAPPEKRHDGDQILRWLEGITERRWQWEKELATVRPSSASSLAPRTGVEEPRALVPALVEERLLWEGVSWDPTATPSYPYLDLRDTLLFAPEEVEDHLIALVEALKQKRIAAVFLPLEEESPWSAAFFSGVKGLLRALHREDPEAPHLISLPREGRGLYPRELHPHCKEYALEEGRMGVRTFAPLALLQGGSPPSGHYLLMGGGRGILSLIAESWEGAELWIAGRRPYPDPALASLTKKELRALAQRRGNREEALSELEADQELALFLKTMRERNREVHYFSCDVRDPRAVQELARTLKGKGVRLEGILYGAGLVKNALWEKSHPEELRLLLGAKLRGAYHCLRLARELRIPRFVGFSSIAYALGNEGQSLYAAANGALRGLIARYPYPEERQVIHFGAWGGKGMATRGVIPELLKERGVELIPPERGVHLFFTLFANPQCKEAIVREGVSWELPGPALTPETRALLPFSLREDPALPDHALEGEPVCPGVYGLAGYWQGFGFAPVAMNFLRRITHRGKDGWLLYEGNEKEGYVVEQELGAQARAKPAYRYQRCSSSPPSLPPFTLEQLSLLAADRREIYPPLFHGERFQILAPPVVATKEGVFAPVVLPDFWKERGAPFLMAMKVEALLQLAGFWQGCATGELLLPVSVEVHPLLPSGAHLTGCARVVLEGREGEGVRFRGEFLSWEGMRELAAIFTLKPLREGSFPRLPQPSFPGLFWEEGDPENQATLLPRQRRELQSKNARRAGEQLLSFLSLGASGTLLPLPSLEGLNPEEPLLLPWQGEGVPFSHSRSHTLGAAVFALAPLSQGRVGVDLEGVAPRAPGFWETISHREEGKLLPYPSPELLTLFFSCKEAVLKALGTGLKLPLPEVVLKGIVPRTPWSGVIQGSLEGEASERARTLHLSSSFFALYHFQEGKVRVLAFLPGHPGEGGTP